MRKIASFIPLLVLIFVTGCGSFGAPKIEDYTWEMSKVAHLEDGKSVIAAGESEFLNPDAKISSMTLKAENGKLTITDSTNNKTYEGTYKVESKTYESTIYSVTIDGKSGFASVAMTTYADGSERPTLPIKLGDYSIYFYAD